MSYEPEAASCTYLIQGVVTSAQQAYRYLRLHGVDTSKYDVIKTSDEVWLKREDVF